VGPVKPHIVIKMFQMYAFLVIYHISLSVSVCIVDPGSSGRYSLRKNGNNRGTVKLRCKTLIYLIMKSVRAYICTHEFHDK